MNARTFAYVIAVAVAAIVAITLIVVRMSLASIFGLTDGDMEIPPYKLILLNVLSLITNYWWLLSAILLLAGLGVAQLASAPTRKSENRLY